MKWISPAFIFFMIALLPTTVAAGLFDAGGGGQKSCECAEACQPHLCCPTIARPQHVNVYTYQRRCSDLGLPVHGCAAVSTCCAPDQCAPHCAAPDQLSACHPSGGCAPCCAVPSCQAPMCAAPGCCVPSVCQVGSTCGADGCGQSCCVSADDECRCLHSGGCHSREACRDIAELIYESMTACYASERRTAIHRLGDYFDCCCHPEVMNAFIYALNDSDERVRAKAADEIGDQIRRNRCICGSPVICALTHALADRDRSVRRQAQEALELSGYRIVDGCCQLPSCQHNGSVWMGAKPAAPPLSHHEGSDALPATERLSGDLAPADAMPTLAPPESVVPEPVPSVPAGPAVEDHLDDLPPAPPQEFQTYAPYLDEGEKPKKATSRLASLLGLGR